MSNTNPSLPIKKQRLAIIFTHVKAFLILAYAQSGQGESFGVFNINTLMLGFLWLMFFLTFGYLVKSVYKNSCDLLWNGIFFLTSIGTIILQRLSPTLASRQMLWLFLAFLVMLLIPFGIKTVRKLEEFELVYLFVGLVLLSSTIFFGVEMFGAERWLQIGSFRFQPSEPVTFLYIFYLATVFRKNLDFKGLIFPSAMAVLYVLILVYQRNLGSALIFFMTYMIMMYISTGRLLLFGAGMGLFALGSVFSYHVFSHVRIRVAIWQNPWVEPHGIGLQIIQSLFAVGTWGLFGSGLTRGVPGFVPVIERDLPFAAISEEFGAIFAFGLIGIYIMIFYRGVHIALRVRRRYHSLLAIGFTAALAFQTFLIIGGTIGFVPLTGVTLPFISYGGSSFVTSAMMIGIIQWIFAYYNKEDKGDEA